MSKRSSKKRRRTLPALGLASVSLSMASGACAVQQARPVGGHAEVRRRRLAALPQA